MYTIRKQFTFEMAHQLSAAASQECVATIHGHSYVIEVFLESRDLDRRGMVIDFGALQSLKAYVAGLDHALMLPDTLPKEYLDTLKRYNQKLIIVPFNPTAENMARMLYEAFSRLPGGHSVAKVRLHETTTGWAEFRPFVCEFIGGKFHRDDFTPS